MLFGASRHHDNVRTINSNQSLSQSSKRTLINFINQGKTLVDRFSPPAQKGY